MTCDLVVSFGLLSDVVKNYKFRLRELRKGNNQG